MELKDYLAIVRRWAWLLALGFVAGAILGGVASFFQSPVYEASTRVLVMRAPLEKTTDYTYLSDQQLVQSYIQLLTTRPVIEGASTTLGYEIDPEQIDVEQIRDTQAIQLKVEDGDPRRAADTANVLIQVLIQQNEIIQAGRYTSTEQSIQAQITQVEAQIAQMGAEIENVSAQTVQEQQKQVEAQIAALQTEVAQLEADIKRLTASSPQSALLAEKQARLEQIQPVLALYQQIYTDLVVLGKPVTTGDGATRLAQMQTTLQLYQQIYISLINNLEEIRLARLQNTPNVVQIESATVPEEPVRPRPALNVGLSAVVGLLLAGGLAILIDYVDDTIRSPEDIERLLNLPVTGYIADLGEAQGELDALYVARHPRSPAAEAFRSLRTNLDFANVDSSLSRILITSPGPGEGKTTIAANLAAIMAQGGKRVLLMDADLRRPRIHSIFNLSNRVGLSALFRGPTPLHSIMQPAAEQEGLFVLTSGRLPPNPTELLASARMDQILQEADRSADVIVIDSPPSLVADFQVLASKVDGVILVIQPGVTHAGMAAAAVDQLKRVNARIFGAILNRIPANSHYYGGYYRYPYKRGHYYHQQEPLPDESAATPLLQPSQPAPARLPLAESMEALQILDERQLLDLLEAQAPPPGKEVSASTNAITKPRRPLDESHPAPVEIIAPRKRPMEFETVSSAVVIEPLKPSAPSPRVREESANEPRLTRRGFFVYYFGQEEEETGKIKR
ncbi:MAG: polysaccharide biosynthesis tyrosine autokinase [Chloroflexota bacterium]